MTSIDSAVSSVIAAKKSAVDSQVAFAIAAKQLSVTKDQGEAATQLVEAAAQLSKAIGKGLHFDAQA